MIALATADEPDVLCLQEVPAWALDRFTVGDVAALPHRRAVADPGGGGSSADRTRITALFAPPSPGRETPSHVGPRLRVLAARGRDPEPAPLRAAAADELGLDLVDAARVGQGAAHRAGSRGCCTTTDARSWSQTCTARARRTSGCPHAELLRAATFAARPGGAGRRRRARGRLQPPRLEPTPPGADRRRLGLLAAGPGIDHVLVRGAPASEPCIWQTERRVQDGAPALRSRAGRGRDQVSWAEARSRFPVLARHAYLNAGTNGPLARATIEAVSRLESWEAENGRGGQAYFDEMLERRERVRGLLAAQIRGAARPRRAHRVDDPAACRSSSSGSGSARATRSSRPTPSISGCSARSRRRVPSSRSSRFVDARPARSSTRSART